MPVKIRLARHGRKRRPFYYIIAADSRAPRDGRYIERIGSYNPNTNPATIDLDFDKALSWLQKGAQPSDTCRSILSYQGVMYKNHLVKGIAKGALTEEQVEEKFQTWMKEKEAKIQTQKETLSAKATAEDKKRMDAEIEVNQARAEALAKRAQEETKKDEEEVEDTEEKVEETTSDE